MLLTPRMLLTQGCYWRQSQWTERWTPKFNVSGRHQVNPVGSGGEGEKMWGRWTRGQEVVGGKKWLMPSKWTIDKKILTSHLPCWFVKLTGKFPPFILVSYLYHRFFILTFFTSGSHWVDLVSPRNVELWCSTFRSLTLASVTPLAVIICAWRQ